MHNLTQPSTSNTQHELVTKVPASLVTTKPSDQGIPPSPPPRRLMPPIKRVLPVKSTEQITEALKEVMLELEPTSLAMKKYRKYLQKQNIDDDNITTINCNMASAQDSVQNLQTRTVQHNHVFIKYQQPPDLATINHVLEILVATTRSFAQKNLVQIPYIQDYINQIIPFLLISGVLGI